jgi:hypothetical protein
MLDLEEQIHGVHHSVLLDDQICLQMEQRHRVAIHMNGLGVRRHLKDGHSRSSPLTLRLFVVIGHMSEQDQMNGQNEIVLDDLKTMMRRV